MEFKEILTQMLQTYVKKNHDYGNAYDENLDEEGLAAARIAIGNKWRRFKNLSKNPEQNQVQESLEDTLLDMANYAVLTLMWMKNKKTE